MTAAAPAYPYELVWVELDGGASEAWRQCADVLCARTPFPHPVAVRLACAVLLRYPGCLVSVVRRSEGGYVVGLRRGGGADGGAGGDAGGGLLVVTDGVPARSVGPAAGPRRCR